MKLKYLFLAILPPVFIFVISIFFVAEKIDVTQKPAKADLIVCLGGGYAERLYKGVELYTKGFSDKIVFTGSGIGQYDSNDKIGFWKIYFLLEHGIAKKDIIFLEHAHNTYEEIQEIKKYMLKHHHKSVLIVSDPTHSRRIRYLISFFRYKQNKLDAKIIGSGAAWWNIDKSISSLRSFWEVAKEVIAIGYYYLRYL